MEQIAAKTILSGYATHNRWFGIHYNMNLYKGCSHGCIYCDSRSACYGIENFDTVRVKQDALRLLAAELPRKRHKGVVGTGAMSDPYHPGEAMAKVTRGALALLAQHRFGVAIATKSDLVVRDSDYLVMLRQQAPVLVKMTITTADDALSRKIEPRAPVSSRRLQALEKLAAQGICCGVLLMPVLPFIEDDATNIAQIVRLAKEHGATFVYPAFGVTLRQNQREWYYQQLQTLFPGMAERYRRQFGQAYQCQSPKAAALWPLFQECCREQEMLYNMEDIIAAYQTGYEERQLKLF